jgi:hypothetical protein
LAFLQFPHIGRGSDYRTFCLAFNLELLKGRKPFKDQRWCRAAVPIDLRRLKIKDDWSSRTESLKRAPPIAFYLRAERQIVKLVRLAEVLLGSLALRCYLMERPPSRRMKPTRRSKLEAVTVKCQDLVVPGRLRKELGLRS